MTLVSRTVFAKTTTTLGLIGLLAFSSESGAQHNDTPPSDWQVSVGGGVALEPIFEGSNTSEVAFMPFIDVEWRERVFFNFIDGLGVNIYRGEDATLSMALGLEDGRKEDDDAEFLKGVGDVADETSVNMKFEYSIGPLTPYAMVIKHLGESEAMQARGGIEAKLPLLLMFGKKLNIDETTKPTDLGPLLVLDVAARWGNKDYMNTFFGVSEQQAATSRFSPYALDAGIKAIDTDLSLLYPVTDSWALKLSAEVSQLSSEIADSPLVQSATQATYKLRVKYNFH